MDHIAHQREVMKLHYVPFNYPAISWHSREGNRKFNERLDREGLRGRGSEPSYDPIMSDA